MVTKKSKKNKVERLSKEIKKLEKAVEVRKFDNFFLILLLFILVLEFFLIAPSTSEIIKKVPMIYLSVFYLFVFLFPVWILFSYYFNTFLRNKTKCATRMLFGGLIKGLVYFIAFISVLSFLVLETKEIAILLLSEVFIQVAVLIGLAIVIFSFLLKIYLCKFSKYKFCEEKI